MLLVAVAVALLAGNCSSGDNDERLTVFVASSLADVLGDLGDAWKSSGGSELLEVVGGSNHLAAQLRDGAPADVFLTADAALLDGLSPDRAPIAVLNRLATNQDRKSTRLNSSHT